RRQHHKSSTQTRLWHGAFSQYNSGSRRAIGMTQWVAQTRTGETKCIAPYYYKDSVFQGFRGSHWLSGSCTQDYGSATLMPMMGRLKTNVADYAVSFSHADETAQPHYYALNLKQAQLKAELTATARCGMLKITALTDDTLFILITPNSNYAKAALSYNKNKETVFVENKVHRIYQGWGELAGFSGYSAIQFDKKIAVFGSNTEGVVFPKNESVSNQAKMGFYVGFKMKKGRFYTSKLVHRSQILRGH
ncbi:MAG: hypothetical protein HC817_15700, partial [Saprospiraceae bacterium]|nr:hypothetical protein [Saprospiraceae bacterium]